MGWEGWPSLSMVMVQVGFAGLNVVSKLALDSGMSPFVMVAYRQIFASLFLSPIAYFVERKTRMKFTKSVLWQIFLCSTFGATLNQFLYFLGLKYSTPTIACALSNTLPAITFIMAVFCRMECVRIKKLASQAKLIGTALCVGGAMIMTFYKGHLVPLRPSGIHWTYVENLTGDNPAAQSSMIIGALLVTLSCVAWAIWFIIQARMTEAYTSPYTSSALMCAMSSVQCVAVAVGFEHRLSGWALGFNIRLFTALYTGIVNSGISFVVMSWCIQKRGPLYVSMFSPLLLIIVAVLGWAILDEKLYVGSVIGSILVVVGLYAVLWGKGKELEEEVNASKIVDKDCDEVGNNIGLALWCDSNHENGSECDCEKQVGEP